MTIHEIRCDACGRSFQTMDQPTETEAQGYGWHVGDLTLCPGCSVAAVEPAASYGQHHWPGWPPSSFWSSISQWCYEYSIPWGREYGAHRLTDARRLTVNGLAHCLDDESLRRALNIRAERACADA